MNARTIGAWTICGALLAGAAGAEVTLVDSEATKLSLTVNTVGTLQTLQHEDAHDAQGKPLSELEAGFQNAFGDLGFKGLFGKQQEIEVVFDLYLSSRNHPSTTYGNEGYMVVHGVPENLEAAHFLRPLFEKVDVKAGHFLLGFGDQLAHRSNNAIVQRNPLVGNFVIDPNLVTIGLEVASKPGRFEWLLGASNGTTTEDWNVGRGFAYHGKLAVHPLESLRASVSHIAADHGDNPPRGTAGGSSIQMFTGSRSGERYGGVLGGGQAPGTVFPQAGKQFKATQVDLTFDADGVPVELYGHYGVTRDRDINGSLPGSPEEEWRYYAGDVVYRFTREVYAAARYSAAEAATLAGHDSSGRVDRLQIGGGLWLTRNLLTKVEYVEQRYRDFVVGEMVNNGIQAWRDPSFRGFVSEVSFSF